MIKFIKSDIFKNVKINFKIFIKSHYKFNKISKHIEKQNLI